MARTWWSRLATVGAVVVAMALFADDVQAQKGYNAGGSRAPDGIWFSGGVNAASGARWRGGGAGIRLEVGIPLTLAGPGQLGLALPFSTLHRGRGWGTGWRGRTNVVRAVPEVQWEYVFPIRMPHRLSISPQAGFGFGGLWHSHWDGQPARGTFLIIFGTGAVVRFGMDNGFMVQMQPVGVSFNVPTHGGYAFWAGYEWYTTIGYRWD